MWLLPRLRTSEWAQHRSSFGVGQNYLESRLCGLPAQHFPVNVSTMIWGWWHLHCRSVCLIKDNLWEMLTSAPDTRRHSARGGLCDYALITAVFDTVNNNPWLLFKTCLMCPVESQILGGNKDGVKWTTPSSPGSRVGRIRDCQGRRCSQAYWT